MLFRNSVKTARIRAETNKDNIVSLSDNWSVLADFFGLDPTGMTITDKTSMQETTIYICMKILSETISKLPLKIYQNNNGIKKADSFYLYNLLKTRPNPYMSPSDFWKCNEIQRNRGNAYVWIERNPTGYPYFGSIKALYPLDPHRVTIWVDNRGIINSDCKMYYIYKDDQQNEYKIDSSDMLHFKSLTQNGIVGINPVKYLQILFQTGKASLDFLNKSFKNGMQASGLVFYTGDLSEDKEKQFKEKFARMSSGLNNANKIALLPYGYTYQPLQIKLTDAQFLENSEFTERQIAAAFGIKLHQLNKLEKSSYASTSEAEKEFYTDTLMPILTCYEQEMNYKLFSPDEQSQGYYCKFNADAMLRADEKERFATYAVAVENAIMTPNEARNKEEWSSLPGGDQLMLNGALIPATMAGKQSKGDDNNAKNF